MCSTATRPSCTTIGWCLFVIRRSRRQDPPVRLLRLQTQGDRLAWSALLPGLIEAHSRLASSIQRDSLERSSCARVTDLRIARATNHLRNTLMAGFTTIRDLGTEGAGYATLDLNKPWNRNHSRPGCWWLRVRLSQLEVTGEGLRFRVARSARCGRS